VARRSKLAPAQWIEIEAKYRATDTSVRELADEYEINEAAIRQRARKFCWVRQPAEAKRALVEARVAGITTQTPREATQALLDAQADLDAETLSASARFYRKVIGRAEDQLTQDDGVAKPLVETVKLATEGYMKVRGLDKPDAKSNDSFSKIKALTDQLRAERGTL
jgi:hypothetical protein